MIVLVDTSTPICRLTIITDNGDRFEYEWEAGRELARNLHGWLHDRLEEHGKTWQDITGIGAFRGPGSFTGLRIGLTVLNTLADSLSVPIVGVDGEGWTSTAFDRLRGGNNDEIVLPYYDRDANITTQRK